MQKKESFCQALGSYGKRGTELQPVLKEHQVLNPKSSKIRDSPSTVAQNKGDFSRTLHYLGYLGRFETKL